MGVTIEKSSHSGVSACKFGASAKTANTASVGRRSQ